MAIKRTTVVVKKDINKLWRYWVSPEEIFTTPYSPWEEHLQAQAAKGNILWTGIDDHITISDDELTKTETLIFKDVEAMIDFYTSFRVYVKDSQLDSDENDRWAYENGFFKTVTTDYNYVTDIPFATPPA
jgi:hypothetical protein